MELCCLFLETMLEYAGDAGAAIIAVKKEQEVSLQFQFRVLSYEDQLRLKQEGGSILVDPESTVKHLKVATIVPLKHCPGCGMLLSKVVRKNSTCFSVLANQHERLLAPW